MDYNFDIMNDEFKTFGHYAKKFNVQTSTVTYWSDNYGLPYVMPGGVRYTTDKAFAKWMKIRSLIKSANTNLVEN
jgi:hypothetical protein|tara:strand:- start:7723 stop:7947 length:225 start_codon:yes stop_codon:yes gene_type:complete